MTVDEALTAAGSELDRVIARTLHSYERSILMHDEPLSNHAADRAWCRQRLAIWRDRVLREIRAIFEDGQSVTRN